jgi:hypothetical protein
MKTYFLVPIFGALALSWQVNAVAATYVRYEVHSPQGQKAIVSMQKAFVKLKALGCTKTVSWYFQSAIHGVPNPKIQGKLDTNPLCLAFNKASKPYAAWSKCASHANSGSPSDIHFLPWHRVYLMHFEKIIRKYSADPTFALPYWDYEHFPTLPDKLQAKSKGSLYEPGRLTSLNQGKPIDSVALKTIKLDSIALQDVVDYATYNDQLNHGQHDFMHDYIGGTTTSYNKIYNDNMYAGLMGNVPSAAFDPVFWLHHSNIDRLWQNWMIQNPGQNVTLGQLNSIKWPYTFYKENGYGISYNMTQVLALSTSTDYEYDKKASAPAAKGKMIPQRLEEHNIATIPLNTVATMANPANIDLNLTNEQLQVIDKVVDERIILNLTVAYAGKPRGRYEVYINLPENVSSSSIEAKKYFTGAISFFIDDPEGKGAERKFRYDLTDELVISRQAMNTIRLTVVKTTGPAEGSITVKNAEISYLN